MNRLLQNAPNYYDDSNAFDHAERVKVKPQVESLPIFEKDGCGRPHRVHRSKSAIFLACGELNASSRVGIALSIRELR